MRAQFQKILINEGSSFIARKLDLQHFDSEYHFHPEYELKYVIQSRGKRFVGDSVENFREGDLVLVGPDIPHYWNNDPDYYVDDSLRASAFLVMFSRDCMGSGFFTLPEMRQLNEFLYRAKGGIFFPGARESNIPGKLDRLISCDGPLKVMHLLDILYDLSRAESRPLLTETFINDFPLMNYSDRSIRRLKKVHEYVIANFQSRILIQDVAEMASMTTHAFCKYFKRSTKKTFMTFLAELRVCHAKKLLIENRQPVYDICLESGFDNLSNFNRKFKLITGMTPTEFRRLYMN